MQNFVEAEDYKYWVREFERKETWFSVEWWQKNVGMSELDKGRLARMPAAWCLALSDNVTVKRLDLSVEYGSTNPQQKAFSRALFAVLCDLLKTNIVIREIRAVGISIGDTGAVALAEALGENSTVTTLGLSHNFMDKEGALALAEALKVNSSVCWLDLSVNFIGKEGGVALAEALKVNSAVTTLHLRHTSIGRDGAVALAEALKVNSAITTLRNAIGSDGAAALAGALKVNNTVAELNLGSNYLGSEGAVALAEALKVNSAVTFLGLETNCIDDVGILAFVVEPRRERAHVKVSLEHNMYRTAFTDAALRKTRPLGLAYYRDGKPSLAWGDCVKQHLGDNLTGRFLLEHVLGVDEEPCDPAYSAVGAAWRNDAAMALKHLRRWPHQTAEVMEECSPTVSRSSRPGCLYQLIQDVRQNAGNVADGLAVQAVQTVLSALQGKSAMMVANVHICGEGCAGKSTVAKALQQTFNSSAFAILYPALDVIPLAEGRTRGMVCAELTSKEWFKDPLRIQLHDYGGQEEFRANHAAHLAAPNSVYLLVVPLWDMRPKSDDADTSVDKPMDLDYAEERYRNWLKFINSVASGTSVKCLTVLNFADQYRKRLGAAAVEKAVERITAVQSAFKATERSRLEFVPASGLILVNAILPGSVHRWVVKMLKDTILNATAPPIPLGPALQAVLADMQVKDKWPHFSSEADLQALLRAAIREKHSPSFHPDLVSNPAVTEDVVRTIAEITQGMLEARRDIVVFPLQSGERISINHPNWLTEQLLGSLFNPKHRKKGGGLKDHLLTHEHIASAGIPERSGLEPAQLQQLRALLPKLLQHVGACLPVVYQVGQLITVPAPTSTDTAATASSPPVVVRPEHYFPAFNVIPMTPKDAKPLEDPAQAIVRHFKLEHPETSMIPPGYFPSLIVDVVGLYQTSNRIWLYQNGLELLMERGLRVIVRGDPDNAGFTLEVEVKKGAAGTVSAWEEMCRVREVVVSTTSWRRTIPLEEYGLHPEDWREYVLSNGKKREADGILISDLEGKLKSARTFTEVDKPYYSGVCQPDQLGKLETLVIAGLAKIDAKQDSTHSAVAGLTAMAQAGFTSLADHAERSAEAARQQEARSRQDLEGMLEVLALRRASGGKGGGQVVGSAAIGHLGGPDDAPHVYQSEEGSRGDDLEAQLWSQRAAQFLEQRRALLQAAELTTADQLRDMKDQMLGFAEAVREVQQDTLRQLQEREAEHRAAAQTTLREALSGELALLRGSIAAEHSQQAQRLGELAEQLRAASSATVPSEIHRELQLLRREVKAVRTVQDNAVYGVFDVPLIPIITQPAAKGLVDQVKGLAYETWRLHFACPVCGTPVRSGPKGEGYELQATRQWVGRVNKVVSLGLTALSVLSHLTTVALPGIGKLADYLNTEFIDVKDMKKAVKDVERELKGTKKWLKSAQDGVTHVMKDATANAQTVNALAASHSTAVNPTVPETVRVDLDYVATLREVLLALRESSPPKRTGLVRAVCRESGECAWVCGADGEKEGRCCRAAFAQHGTACAMKVEVEFV